MQDKIIDIDELHQLKGHGKIVHCHGVFDIFHTGHLAYLEAAKKYGNTLVVSITTDRFVNKGPGRPHFSAAIRARVIAALEIVDYVIISDHPTATPVISALRPAFYVKGPDYRDKTKDVTKEIYNEEREVEAYGGQLVFTEDETFSSSTLANKFFLPWTDQQIRVIERVKELGGIGLIHKYLEDIAKLDVLIVGEPIIDTYRFCNPQNLSSKSPSISAEFLYEENYLGGSLAIANHLVDFCQGVKLMTAGACENWVHSLMAEKLDQRITLQMFEVESPTPRKTRYIAIDKLQRIFEITELKHDMWEKSDPGHFINQMTWGQDEELAILADFGHGLFEGRVLGACHSLDSFVALNVQTNSSNYGFNPYKKHRRYDYLSLDVREAQVAFHDRTSPALELFKQIHMDVHNVSLTLGKNGAYFHTKDKESFAPAFADSVVDATGAGDAYFGLTSLFVKVGAEPEVIPFVGNVFAGLKTKIIGNKLAVSKAQFLKAVESILK